ncbi:unnamed protein product [Brassica oleracea var. botrytis]|uniref:Uncharacterized protein n=1 Tax=Brassica oleracea TaxID=3712 RepID=A0A3P6GNF1_BRAOL|nr:unnamed protein product [Brassica oleracea]
MVNDIYYNRLVSRPLACVICPPTVSIDLVNDLFEYFFFFLIVGLGIYFHSHVKKRLPKYYEGKNIIA